MKNTGESEILTILRRRRWNGILLRLLLVLLNLLLVLGLLLLGCVLKGLQGA